MISLSTAMQESCNSYRNSFGFAASTRENGKLWFEELTAHYTREDKARLEEKLALMPELSKDIVEHLHSLIQKFSPTDPWLKSEEFDFWAIKAMIFGLITRNQFCTLMIFKSALKEPFLTPSDILVLPLYSIGSQIHRDNSTPSSPCLLQKSAEGIKSYTHISLKEFLAIFQSIYVDTLSLEQMILLFPVHGNAYDTLRITTRLKKIKFSLYNTVKLEKKRYFIVPSFTLMEATLKTVFAKQRIKIHPVLSCSSVDNIREEQLYENRRAMQIPFSFSPPPEEADQFKATELDFIKHDFYHIFSASTAPQAQRNHMLQLSKFCSEEVKTYPMGSFLSSYFTHLNHVFADLEIPSYRRDCQFFIDGKKNSFFSTGICFWHEISDMLDIGYGKAFIDHFAQNLTKKEIDRNEYNMKLKELLTGDGFKKLMKFIKEHFKEYVRAQAPYGSLLEAQKVQKEDTNGSLIFPCFMASTHLKASLHRLSGVPQTLRSMSVKAARKILFRVDVKTISEILNEKFIVKKLGNRETDKNLSLLSERLCLFNSELLELKTYSHLAYMSLKKAHSNEKQFYSSQIVKSAFLEPYALFEKIIYFPLKDLKRASPAIQLLTNILNDPLDEPPFLSAEQIERLIALINAADVVESERFFALMPYKVAAVTSPSGFEKRFYSFTLKKNSLNLPEIFTAPPPPHTLYSLIPSATLLDVILEAKFSEKFKNSSGLIYTGAVEDDKFVNSSPIGENRKGFPIPILFWRNQDKGHDIGGVFYTPLALLFHYFCRAIQTL